MFTPKQRGVIFYISIDGRQILAGIEAQAMGGRLLGELCFSSAALARIGALMLRVASRLLPLLLSSGGFW